ncbi:hypothetical protein HZS55_09205 [Halosimplex rubrum]|uniref:Phage portal protein n=1 Tax=Halosimplex rubrum TaxID=869889 RepID=A0A7D5P4U9_9EURY|nr:hypothetical protein [Halosimplex rubrum]QLH77462.1 hypothetical protein HZS55_09205 [Halosimplex rubrum]
MEFTKSIRAALARDGEPDPQARDSEFDAWATTLDVDRKEPERGDIGDWVTEYQENPLIRIPTQTFTSDVLEPGQRVNVDGDEIPTVSEEYYDEDLRGEDLDDALEAWLGGAGIVNGEFGHDLSDVLEKLIKDCIGRRGTGMTEIVYDDRVEQERIMGIRPIKVETVTAYTREGKNILLRPDDTSEDSDYDSGFSFALPGRSSDKSRDTLPETAAGDTACYVQYDDAIGSWDDNEVRLAQDDALKIAHDADTGDLFGLPATASVYDRASSIRQQWADLDQALTAVAYQHWVAQVATDDEDEAQKLLNGFDPSNPEKVNVVNYDVDATAIGGTMPDIDSTLKQEIEYVLSAFPVPIYRIGFEGEINRDVTSEQSEDYQRELSDWRTDLAQEITGVLQRKAEEMLDDEADIPSVELVIAPRESDNPLERESFDAEAFVSFMQGLKHYAGAGGSPQSVFPPEYLLDTVLGLDAEEVLGGAGGADLGQLDESDPRVRESFENAYGSEPPDPAEVEGGEA